MRPTEDAAAWATTRRERGAALRLRNHCESSTRSFPTIIPMQKPSSPAQAARGHHRAATLRASVDHIAPRYKRQIGDVLPQF